MVCDRSIYFSILVTAYLILNFLFPHFDYFTVLVSTISLNSELRFGLLGFFSSY